MLLAGGAARTEGEAREKLTAALADGRALRKCAEIVEAQEGDPRCVTDPSRLPQPRQRREIHAKRSGFLVSLDAEEVGLAAVELGAGRARKEDRVDPAAGLLLRQRRGDEVRAGETLAELHRASDAGSRWGQAPPSGSTPIPRSTGGRGETTPSGRRGRRTGRSPSRSDTPPATGAT